MAASVAATIVWCTATAHAQAPLGFLGFTPGSTRSATESVLSRQQGSWHCAGSTVDPRFTECRGRIAPSGVPSFQLTGSLVRDSLAILLLATEASDAVLRGWLEELAGTYGPAAVRGEHGITTRQWVRARRMIRVTSRRQGGRQMVSVSLVDGVLLDALDAISSPPASSSGRASPPS